MRALPLLCACLVVLAGCNGLGGGDSDGDVTPADVPRDLHGGTIAPGLTESELVNASALATAHERVLANRSFAATYRLQLLAANGSVIRESVTRGQYAADRLQYNTSARYTGGFAEARGTERRESWADGDHRYVRWSRGGEWEYQRQQLRPPARLSPGDTLEPLLSGATGVAVERLDTEGEWERYRVEATEFENLSGNVENATLTAVVDERGLVSEVRVVVVLDTGHQQVVRVTYSAVGETTVERPAWADEALERVNATGG
ncbi:DUF7537 family lipoprotein [Halomarina litorea]|uniref:DUF7537 family lipoprotein n=1 Tax=Halomarina litorea TaxID=2961595 RepID=UPI0020C548BC|nr:hypothetical protein [Halomarina sp. BCD28]